MPLKTTLLFIFIHFSTIGGRGTSQWRAGEEIEGGGGGKGTKWCPLLCYLKMSLQSFGNMQLSTRVRKHANLYLFICCRTERPSNEERRGSQSLTGYEREFSK